MIPTHAQSLQEAATPEQHLATTSSSVERFISAARTCLGTRFRHQGRSGTYGLDCVGLVVFAAAACGLKLKDFTSYGRMPRPDDLAAYLAQAGLAAVEPMQKRSGDIGVFDFGQGPQHVAILTPHTMVHAYAPARKVVENSLRGKWCAQLTQVYRIDAFS